MGAPSRANPLSARSPADRAARRSSRSRRPGSNFSGARPTPARAPLADADFAGELVLVAGTARKMVAERPAHFRERMHEAVARSLLPHALENAGDQPLPVLFAHPLVNALVADDRELSVGHRDVDEDAVAVGGLVHAQPLEDLDGALERIARARVVEVHADLRRGVPLRLRDGAHDGLEVVVGEKCADPFRMPGHHQSPLEPPPPKPPPPPPPGKMMGPPQPREPPVHPWRLTCELKSAGTTMVRSPPMTMKSKRIGNALWPRPLPCACGAAL